MTNYAELEEKIGNYIEQNFPQGKKIEADTSLINSGIIDSMGIVEIIEHIETKYGIVVEDNEVDQKNFDSVSSIAHFIEAKKKE
jgi:acyl carrier protein